MSTVTVVGAGCSTGPNHIVLAGQINKQFLKCRQQQLARKTIIDRVLNADLVISTKVGHNNYEFKMHADDYLHQLWYLFTHRIIDQLILYGFALYRTVETTRKGSADLMSDHKQRLNKKLPKAGAPKIKALYPQVADGMDVVIEWNEEAQQWIFTHTLYGEMTSRQGWHVVMYTEPKLLRPSNIIIYTSMSSHAYELSATLEKHMRYCEQRDRINSTLSVFTQMSKYFGVAPGGNKPMIHAAIQQGLMSVPRSVYDDVDQAIRDRFDAAQKLTDATERMRKSTYDAYTIAHSLDPYDMRRTRVTDKKTQHEEHIISQPFDATQINRLHSPENIDALIERYENGILLAYQIPPQFLGKNINSERIAASNRLAESAIERGNDMIRTMRKFVNMAIKELSKEMMTEHSDSSFLYLRPCVSQYNLSMLTPILKTDVALELTACINDIPEYYIDKKSLKQQQELLLSDPKTQGSTPGVSGPAASRSEQDRDRARERKKPKMSTAQKSAAMQNKNAP